MSLFGVKTHLILEATEGVRRISNISVSILEKLEVEVGPFPKDSKTKTCYV